MLAELSVRSLALLAVGYTVMGPMIVDALGDLDLDIQVFELQAPPRRLG